MTGETGSLLHSLGLQERGPNSESELGQKVGAIVCSSWDWAARSLTESLCSGERTCQVSKKLLKDEVGPLLCTAPYLLLDLSSDFCLLPHVHMHL